MLPLLMLAGCAGPAPVRQATVEPAAFTPTEEPAEVPPEAPPAIQPEPAAPLPEGTTVLHVGSSSAGALGLELNRMLAEQGVEGILKAKHSTYIADWAGHRMGLQKLLTRHKPDLVLISLGGNEVGIPDPTVRAKTIRKLIDVIGDRPCVWIGTPRWPKLRHNGLLEVIRDNVAPCAFIDSDELAPAMDTIRDGVHPTGPERSRWARRVVQWLQLNRDPHGEHPWSLKTELTLPPAEPSPAEPENSALTPD